MEKDNKDDFFGITGNDIFQDPEISEPPKDAETTVESNLDITRIKERTFNRELSELVTRIRSNETAESANIAQIENQKVPTDDELLQMFHNLYYRAVNLQNIDKVNTSFNPFDLYRELSIDQIADVISGEMNRLGLSDYSILSYNLDKRCYIVYSNSIGSIDEKNIIMDPSEELFFRINDSRNGTIVDNTEIARNIFLKKRFGSNKTLYFLSFKTLFKDFYDEINLENINNLSYYLLPVLIVELERNIEEHQKKDLYNSIRNRLTVYFFLLSKMIINEIRNSDYDDLKRCFKLLDYFYSKNNRSNDCICMIIKCRRYVNIESLLILEYLHNKFKLKLTDESAILRIEKDRLLIFTIKSKRKILDEIIDEFNRLYSNLFQVELFTEEIGSNEGLVQSIKESLLK